MRAAGEADEGRVPARVEEIHPFVQRGVAAVRSVVARRSQTARGRHVRDVHAGARDIVEHLVSVTGEGRHLKPPLTEVVVPAGLVVVGVVAVVSLQTRVWGPGAAGAGDVRGGVAGAGAGVEDALRAHEHPVHLPPEAAVVVRAPPVRVQVLAVRLVPAEVGRVPVAARVGHSGYFLAAAADGVEERASGAAVKTREDLTLARVVRLAPPVLIRILAVPSPLATRTPAAVLSRDAVGSLAGSRQRREHGGLVAGS